MTTYAKSGPTWTQQIVGQLVFQGAPDARVHEITPWLDSRVPPALALAKLGPDCALWLVSGNGA